LRRRIVDDGIVVVTRARRRHERDRENCQRGPADTTYRDRHHASLPDIGVRSHSPGDIIPERGL
jgi:hypothetical protein